MKDYQESEEHKDLHSSWNTKSESKNVVDHASQKFKEFEKSRDHFKKTEGPVYQEVVKNLETPTEQVRVKTRKPVVVEVMKVTEKSKVQPPTEKDADAELEMKLEELTPTEQQPELKTNPPATFHHWREFVDNNPNFPYTIPVNEESTPKRTRITTQYPTTERITTTKTTVKTEPRKTTVKSKKSKPKPHKGGNTHSKCIFFILLYCYLGKGPYFTTVTCYCNYTDKPGASSVLILHHPPPPLSLHQFSALQVFKAH